MGIAMIVVGHAFPLAGCCGGDACTATSAIEWVVQTIADRTDDSTELATETGERRHAGAIRREIDFLACRTPGANGIDASSHPGHRIGLAGLAIETRRTGTNALVAADLTVVAAAIVRGIDAHSFGAARSDQATVLPRGRAIAVRAAPGSRRSRDA